MRKIAAVNKPEGYTPLMVVNQFKLKYPAYAHETISYAGRLDPMASGVLLLLVGDENKKRHEYEKQDKEYISEIVVGITTDSFDLLGMITSIGDQRIDNDSINVCLKSFTGKITQSFPPYSSKPVQGKPLFWWARQGRLDEIEIPKKNIEIYSLMLLDSENITGEILSQKVLEKISKIKGNFRQEKIAQGWKKFGKDYMDAVFLKITLRVECSSGTYIRQLASDIGKRLKSGAFAYSIKRTKVGDYSLSNVVKI